MPSRKSLGRKTSIIARLIFPGKRPKLPPPPQTRLPMVLRLRFAIPHLRISRLTDQPVLAGREAINPLFLPVTSGHFLAVLKRNRSRFSRVPEKRRFNFTAPHGRHGFPPGYANPERLSPPGPPFGTSALPFVVPGRSCKAYLLSGLFASRVAPGPAYTPIFLRIFHDCRKKFAFWLKCDILVALLEIHLCQKRQNKTDFFS
jgi:hypothetical protein